MKSEWYAKRVENGLCVSCGVKIPQDWAGHKRCPTCEKLSYESNHKRYEDRKNRRLCVRCGSPLDGYYVFCSSCREKQNQKGAVRYQMLKAQGICPWCKKPASEGHALCEDCRRIRREYAKEARRG